MASIIEALTLDECKQFLQFLSRLPMNGEQRDAAEVVGGAIGQYVARNLVREG